MSRFPGMNPFVEQEWEDFHTRMIPAIGDALEPKLGPKYLIRLERRVYFEVELDDLSTTAIPDASLILSARTGAARAVAEASLAEAGSATSVAPVECLLPSRVEHRETLLTIRDRQSREVVTVIEVLSPTNKRPGSEGRREYLAKREAVLESSANLVEIDLLRGGSRPPISPEPAGDYCVIVSRAPRRPVASVYSWGVQQPLPPIPVPLRPEDGEVVLPLQQVVAAVLERAHYDESLDYSLPLRPPLAAADEAWLAARLRSG